MRLESRGFTLFLAAMTMLTSVSIDMALPAVPAIERAFGLVGGHGALVLSIFLAGYAITPLIGGPLSDRLGRRPVLLAAVAGFCVFAFACTTARTFPTLLTFRFLQGCVAGIVVALPLAIVRDVFNGHAARQRVSEVTLVNGIMPIVAPLFGAGVMLFAGWRGISTAQAIFALLLFAFTFFQFKETKPHGKLEAFRVRSIAQNYKTVFTHRMFVTFALIYALNFAAIFSFVSVSPLLLMERLHVSRNAYTVMFGSTLIGTVLGSSLSSALSRRAYSARKTISFGISLMMGASLLALVLQWLHMRSPYAILLPAFVTFVCFGLTSPVLTLEALGPFPRLAGAGSGAIRALQMIFGAAASSALAYICASPRVRPGIATTLTMTLTTAAGFALFWPFRKPGLMVSNADAGPGMLDPDIDIDILGH